MPDWFSVINEGCKLSTTDLQELLDVGFVVIQGSITADGLTHFSGGL